jgi:hypothetical protein
MALIHLGIDDTDIRNSPGTNQLARLLVRRVAADYRPVSIVRHQLLFDPRVPYTSKNGSASIVLEARGAAAVEELIRRLRQTMLDWCLEGSDPGLCVAERVPAEIIAFGRQCQREIVDQEAARALAATSGVYLEGLGGTHGGIIGALAAVGLAATGDDGRVVQLGIWPDDLAGPQDVAVLLARGIAEIRCLESGQTVTEGVVDVGKHLRPNLRGGKVVLYVTGSATGGWQAARRT